MDQQSLVDQARAGDLSAFARLTEQYHFLTQPFFIAAPYTHKPGQFVPRQETVRVCRGILDGVYDHLPEDAFYLVGGLDAARAGDDGV